MVTAFRNLDICGIVRGCPQARCLSIVDCVVLPCDKKTAPLKRLLDHFHDTAPRPRPDNSIRLRDLVEKLLPISLSETPRHNKTAAAPRLLVVCHPKHRRDRFLFRRLNECTRVDDQDIRLRWLIGDIDAMFTHDAEHNLSIDQILCTAKADKTCFH